MDWWPIIAAVLAVLAVLYYRVTRNFDFFEKREIPYVKPMPFFGNMWEVIIRRHSFPEVIGKIYNSNPESKYVGFFEFDTPLLVIRDLDLIKSITVKNFDHFPNHRLAFDPDLDPLFSKNLFSLRDERWKEVRNILTPAFTSSKMKSMFVLMRDCAKDYGDYFASLPADQSKEFELKDAFAKYTNDVIATCAFGVDVNSMKNPRNTFYLYGREATNFGAAQILRFLAVKNFPWLCRLLGIKAFKHKIIDFFEELVANTIKTRDENGIVRPDMIHLMMETRGKLGPGKELTIDDMTAQAFVFFIGGFESTSTLMCFAAYEVGINDHVQKRLQDEIDQVLEDCNGEVTYEAINGMKYLDAVILESLRMYPSVVGSDRVCTKPFELPPRVPGAELYVVQPGDTVWIPISCIQHDPQYYPEPKKFNPDRFYDDSKLSNSLSFLSFGLGPRMCIGNRFALLEAKVLLFYIFANCDLAPCAKSSKSLKLVSTGFAVVPENGFWLKIQPRNAKRAQPEKIAIAGSTMLIEKVLDRHSDN
ncbi:hypothetical protein E2986_12663 [Frieseomelitta varia]|uniref:Cytochrome P450 n=1 Tax=Frieseomelitta varia TaxID=561572 RepID=A0A833RSC2_9HYME|nr:cytochrome P450 9e2-like isoform X1 [Frieseomelitta varia]KAF3426863.1 hypothetical protein E2986_12663 [Frieseomelitta varia]